MELDYNRFKPILNTNLCIPSVVNAYCIGIEFMRNWFLKPFQESYDGYFQVVHIFEKHLMEDFKRYDIGDFATRPKPSLTIIPGINLDFDLDNILTYNHGSGDYIRRSNPQKSFFKDVENNEYIGLDMNLYEMPFTFRMRLDTKAQAIDLYSFILLNHKVKGTWNMDIDMDFHIPQAILLNLAKARGFDIIKDLNDNFVIKEPYKFLKYLNKYSSVPILYKLRMINGHYEYFVRSLDTPIHISTLEKPDVDNGETQGMLHTNYTVEFTAVLRIPAPKFYIYFSKEKCSYNIPVIETNNKSTFANMYSFSYCDIPEVNDKGWVQVSRTQYVPEKDEKIIKSIPIKELIIDDNNVKLLSVIKDSLDHYISPMAFIEVAVYLNHFYIKNKIKTRVDWENMILYIEEDIPTCMLYISVYIDLSYVNEKTIQLTNANKSRI